MGRFPQQAGLKGSQKWLQWLVNDSPELFDQRIGLGRIDWRSPLRADDFAEYRDQDFLNLLSIELPARPLDPSGHAGDRSGTRLVAHPPVK